MNLIEAWNKAKYKQVISRMGTGLCLSKNDGSLTGKIHNCVMDSDLIADDWEIVKEKKKVVLEEIGLTHTIFCHEKLTQENTDKIHKACGNTVKMTLEWEEG